MTYEGKAWAGGASCAQWWRVWTALWRPCRVAFPFTANLIILGSNVGSGTSVGPKSRVPVMDMASDGWVVTGTSA